MNYQNDIPSPSTSSGGLFHHHQRVPTPQSPLASWVVPLMEACLCVKVLTLILSLSNITNKAIGWWCDLVLCVTWGLVVLWLGYQIGRWHFWQWFSRYGWYKRYLPSSHPRGHNSNDRPEIVQGISCFSSFTMGRDPWLFTTFREYGRRLQESFLWRRRNNAGDTTTINEETLSWIENTTTTNGQDNDGSNTVRHGSWLGRWLLRRLWIDTTNDDSDEDTNGNNIEMQPLILLDPDPNHMERQNAPTSTEILKDDDDAQRDKNV